MADTSVPITAGSGTNVDTRTEATNGNHRQVIVVGDPSTNAGVAPVDATAGLKVDLGADNDVTVTGNVAVTNAGLTEVAAAINASSQMDVNIAASGATVPISHAALTELAAAIDTEVQVDIVSSALPSGAATAAKQPALGTAGTASTDVITVQGIASGTALAVSNAALTELAAAIDTEVQVDVVAPLPAGTNNIGDMDVLSVVPGTGATNLGKAEDAVHSSGDVGIMSLGVRQSSQADFGADGDYVPFSVDDDGGLRVSIVAGAGSGGTAAADDADFTDGTTSGTPAMGVYESTPSTVTDGDLGVVGITEARRLKTSATIDAALPAGTNAIGKLAANSGVDIGDVDITSIAAGDNNIGNVDIVSGTITTVSAVTAITNALPAGTNALGKLLPPDVDVTTHTNYAKKYYTNAGAVTDGIVWSPAAGKRWHVVSMYVQTSADATVTLEDDKAGGDEAVWKGELAGKSGMTINFSEKYPLASGEDAADLIVTTSAGNVYITITGYEI